MKRLTSIEKVQKINISYFEKISEEERRLFNAKIEKRRRQNEIDQEELDRSLEEQRARLGKCKIARCYCLFTLSDSIGALLDHAMMFVNEHPTPETSPWKNKSKLKTPESSPTSEPISPVTVIKGKLFFLADFLTKISCAKFCICSKAVFTPPTFSKNIKQQQK